jgi:uncharacterized protein YndB with AHSA1/START domain
MNDPSPLRVQRRVTARPAAVYAYLTDSALWSRWQGEAADVEASPGGRFRMRLANGMLAEGRFVELETNRRVVFTWGWNGSTTVPPGSSTVEIELLDDGDGTLIRLSHHGLPPDDRQIHEAGWRYYVPRLAIVSEGGDPGPDPGPPAAP